MTHIDDSLLNEYLDHQLDGAARERVRAHLAGCKDCRERLAETEWLFTSLEQLPEAPLMVDLSRQVVERISAEFKPRPIPRWTIPIVALQMLAALALFIWLWPFAQPMLESAGQTLPQTAEQLLPDFSLVEALEPLAGGMENLGEIGAAISPDSPLPILKGFLIIGLALILWLTGSGLLLRQSLIMQNDS